jgi:serine/threonine protein kinase
MGDVTTCLSDGELLGYTDGVMEPTARDRVEAHIDACSRCLGVVGGLARGSGGAFRPWMERRPSRAIAAGTVIAKRYLIRRELGAGAMGEVYEAEDNLLGKTIALKVLNATLAADPRALTRLRSEVALAHRVTHPNVCRIYDIGIDAEWATERGEDPLKFLTMEYLNGQTLSTFVRDHGPSSIEQAFAILKQLASALAAAHEGGVIHRDLKSDNVMLVAQPNGGYRAVVTDFGLAGPVLPVEVRGPGERFAYSGYRAHVAPEQLAGKPASPATDVYSFGLLAYELLMGEALVPGGLFQVEDVPSLPWQRFLRRALSSDSRQRWPNGMALESALLALGRPARLDRRRLSYGALALSLVGAGVFSFGRSLTAPPPSAAPVGRAPAIAEHASTLPAARSPEPTVAPMQIAPVSVVVTRRPKRAVYRVLATEVSPSPGTVVEPAPPAVDRDEIVRDLPARGSSVAFHPDLADPFVARRARAAEVVER